MSQKLFLYVDILGFSDLVSNADAMTEIFDRVDALNVHRDGEFGVIVFSDTMLVYADGGWLDAKNQAVMWLVEFAQDLFYRFVGIDRHFRGYLTIGDFVHSKKDHIEAYYGEALVECYRKEKTIKAMGLFMANALVPYSDIFHTTPYDEDCHFVHLMQRLDVVSGRGVNGGSYPLPGAIIEDTDYAYFLAYDFSYLRQLHGHLADANLDETVRQKYRNTWAMISARHGPLLRALVKSNFDPNAVIPHNWEEPMRRVGTEDGFFG